MNLRRRVQVDVYAIDVLWPVDGAQQSLHLAPVNNIVPVLCLITLCHCQLYCGGQWNRLQLFKLDSQGAFTEKPNTGGTDKESKNKSAKNSLENSTTLGYKCAYLNARSIVNKINN